MTDKLEVFKYKRTALALAKDEKERFARLCEDQFVGLSLDDKQLSESDISYNNALKHAAECIRSASDPNISIQHFPRENKAKPIVEDCLSYELTPEKKKANIESHQKFASWLDNQSW